MVSDKLNSTVDRLQIIVVAKLEQLLGTAAIEKNFLVGAQ